MESRSATVPDRWLTWSLLGVVLGVFLLHAGVFRHYVNDDAYITFRYSRSLAEGGGPYFNPGEHVEGYTNFLQMLIAAGVIGVAGVDAMPAVMKALGVLWGCLAVAAAFLIARALASGLVPPPWQAIAAMLAGLVPALSPGFAVNSTSGLETALYSFGLSLGVLLGLAGLRDGRYRWAGVAFAAAALTRPEGALVFGLYWIGAALATPPGIHRVFREVVASGFGGLRRHPLFLGHLLPDAILVTAAVAGHVVLRLALYDGDWLPNTYYAKSGGFLGFTAWGYVRHGAGTPVGGWLGIAAAIAGWLLLRGRIRPSVAVWSAAVGGAALPLVTGTDWMMGWRLVAPYLPLLGVLAGLGWVALGHRVAPSRPRAAGVVLVVVAATALTWSQSGARERMRERVEIRAEGYRNAHLRLARWLVDRPAPEGAKVALMDIGIVGYYAPGWKILDVTGLTDRYIAKSPGPFLQKQYDLRYVFDQHPDFIVLTLTADGDPLEEPPAFVAWRPWTLMEGRLARDPEFQRRYVRRGPPPATSAPWTDVLAASLGAAKVFSHDYPGQYYLLAVFERAP